MFKMVVFARAVYRTIILSNCGFKNFFSLIFVLIPSQVDEKRILHLSAVTILRRSDKQPDRVEISPEQQTDASIKAEV